MGGLDGWRMDSGGEVGLGNFEDDDNDDDDGVSLGLISYCGTTNAWLGS